MKHEGDRYQTFRENFELRQVLIWTAGIVYFFFWGKDTGYETLSLLCVLICSFFVLLKLPAASERAVNTFKLAGSSLTFVSFEDLKEKLAKHPSDQWLGIGFKWEPEHAQLAAEMFCRNWQSITKEALGFFYVLDFVWQRKWKFCIDPLGVRKDYIEHQKLVGENPGLNWIHGLGANTEDDVFQPLNQAEGHTLIVGTTGSGKTRCFDLLISQAILRNETIFIIDPKGDADLRHKAQRACEALGRGDKFLFFHPAHPKESIRINPLANWTRISEVADRISALIPGAGTAASFKNFSFSALKATAYALTMCSKKPTLRLLKHYISSTGSGVSITPLVFEALRTHFWQTNPELYNHYKDIDPISCAAKPLLKATADMIRLYNVRGPHDSDMDDLLSMYQHNAEHFSKMITSLLPVLSMLTSGSLGDLLSPAETEGDLMSETFFDTKSLIQNNCVVYIGLDSLSDAMVGSAIGSLILSDLACTAGALYNFEEPEIETRSEELQTANGLLQKTQKAIKGSLGIIQTAITRNSGNQPKKRPINIFVDEAAEVFCEPFLQLLNKGRGAGIRCYVATQTVADFSAKMGSKDKAMQLLGNLNNRLCLRCIDTETQKYVSSLIPKTRIVQIERSHSLSSSANEQVPKGGTISERQTEKEAALFSPELLGMLPNLEFVGIISGGKVYKGRYPLIV